MQNYSITYTGVIIFSLGYIYQIAGVAMNEADLKTTIDFIVTLSGVLMTLYGRYKAGGVSPLGFKI